MRIDASMNENLSSKMASKNSKCNDNHNNHDDHDDCHCTVIEQLRHTANKKLGHAAKSS